MGYFWTVIGAIIYGCLRALLGMGVTGAGKELAEGLFLAIAVILTIVGVIKTLIHGDGIKEKLIGLVIHAVVWIVVCWGMTIVVPIVILLVVLFIVDRMFLGGTIYAFIHNHFFAGPGGDWPAVLFDYENSMWMFVGAVDGKAYYKNDSTGETITVNAEDVNEDGVNTIRGFLHYK